MKKYLFSISLLIFVCCNHNPASNYLALDNVEYISEFPLSFELENNTPCEWDIIGPIDFKIVDTLIIFSTRNPEGFWSFHSLPDGEKLGSYFLRGNGPGEFLFSPNIANNSTFYCDESGLNCLISDFTRSRLYNMNITDTFNYKSQEIELLEEIIEGIVFSCLRLEQGKYLVTELDPSGTKQCRYITDGKTRTTTRNMEKLNHAYIEEGEDHNLLTTGVDFNHEKNTVVEVAVSLNQINIYDLADTFGKTICVGSKLDNINRIQKLPKAKRMQTYNGLRLFPKFFGALYMNEDIKTYQTQRKKLPVVQLFDYTGNPLAELRLNTFAQSFDIDMISKELYTFDYSTEELNRYDISDILLRLNL